MHPNHWHRHQYKQSQCAEVWTKDGTRCATTTATNTIWGQTMLCWALWPVLTGRDRWTDIPGQTDPSCGKLGRGTGISGMSVHVGPVGRDRPKDMRSGPSEGFRYIRVDMTKVTWCVAGPLIRWSTQSRPGTPNRQHIPSFCNVSLNSFPL